MDDTTLIVLRDAAVRLIRGCTDEDLIDLVCKLLIESGVEESNGGIIPYLNK